VQRINWLWEENTGPDLVWMTPEQVRAEMRKYVARGMDFIKYAASGHGGVHSSLLMFSPEAQKAIVEEAHRAGLIAQSHTMTVESLRQAIEAGVEMMQHCTMTGPTPIPESTIKLMLDKHVFCAIQPRTNRRMQLDLKKAESALPGLHAKERIQVQHENEVRLIKAGVPILLATDGGTIDPDFAAQLGPDGRIDRLTEFGEGQFVWFQAMTEKGMTPMAAILAATRNIAAAYHKLDELGTVEKGKLADLVVLDADPLQDIGNIRKTTFIMKDGQVVDRDKLPVKRVLTLPRPVVPTKDGKK
jgi:imidazolonepropionase-like amidohydrolase